MIQTFDVYLVPLDPGVGSEIRKTRPCVVASPESMHKFLKTVVVIPLTSGQTGWPTRVPCEFAGRKGEIAIDQIRSVDRRRLVKRIGRLDESTVRALRIALRMFFA